MLDTFICFHVIQYEMHIYLVVYKDVIMMHLSLVCSKLNQIFALMISDYVSIFLASRLLPTMCHAACHHLEQPFQDYNIYIISYMGKISMV